MSSNSFHNYKRDCEQMLEDIRTYSYKNTESQNDTNALYALQSTCFTCRNHSLYRLNASHKLFTGNTADILRKFKTEIETAQQVFKSLVGDTQYYYTEGPHAWHDGPDKTLRPGAKNGMLSFVYSKIHNCLFYIQCMIDIKSAEERALKTLLETKAPPAYVPTPTSPLRASDDEMSVRSDMSLKLERIRANHTFPRNTDIESVEYGEVRVVEKEGFTQIYINGCVACIVTWRNRNDEVILWPDYHTENWLDGKFHSMLYASVEYRYSSLEGRTKWKKMWEKDGNWHKHATEFYLEDNQTSMPVEDPQTTLGGTTTTKQLLHRLHTYSYSL